MRSVMLTAALLSMSLGLPAAGLPSGDASPYLKLTQVVKDGTVRVSIKNISHKPVLAYVVGINDGAEAKTHHDVFTGRDVFAPGKTVELVFAAPSVGSAPKAFVDYVRLSDNSAWGTPVTEDGQEVAARFQK